MSAAGEAPSAFIFDLDGTLVDSFADIATGLNATRAHYGLPALPEAAVRAEVGSGSEYLVRRLVPGPEERLPEALAVFLARYEAVALERTRPYPGVPELLARWRHRPLAVVTNKPLHISRRILQGLGLWEAFRMVLGGDSLPRRKPDPLPVQRVLECFALPPAQVALVGDGLPDMHAGRAAGVRTFAVTTGVTPRAELAAQRPERVLARLDELLALYA